MTTTQHSLVIPACTNECLVHHTTVTPGIGPGESGNNGTVTIILPPGKSYADMLVKDEHGNNVRVHLGYEQVMDIMLRLGHVGSVMP